MFYTAFVCINIQDVVCYCIFGRKRLSNKENSIHTSSSGVITKRYVLRLDESTIKSPVRLEEVI